MQLNLNNARLGICAGDAKQFPNTPHPQIIFSGRSNVGKSSLINTLLGRNSLARVSSCPGKTITVNFYDIDSKLYFVDLPGYGFAKRTPQDKKKWSALVEEFFSFVALSDEKRLVVQLIDMKVGVTKDDAVMLDWLNETGTDYIICATKCDKLNKTDYNKSLQALFDNVHIEPDTDIFPFSALKGTGKQQLLNFITEYAGI
ncbi:MAG: ribosome biogenesis GTP-binding protein YihA/YsxC [Clostridia bacterium]|nr:ribosome biogenesis GTP-binding protein YihA/YsxC [Clostridia bacterium]